MRLIKLLKNGGRKYNDPFYDKTDEEASKKTGVPLNVLKRVRLLGEQSNENWVSDAGARGVYQFIPETRNAVLKKYGVDAWKPEQASLAAAYLLKENAVANNNDYVAAIREYHGGKKRENWGPVNRDYMGRVMGYNPSVTDMLGYNPATIQQTPFDNSEYLKALEEMRTSGQINWAEINKMYEKKPIMTELFLKNFDTEQQFARTQALEQERLAQEQQKEKVEYENQQIQASLEAKQQEREAVLKLIPQSGVVASGNIKPNFYG